jgi:hypothetical protein
MIARVQQAILLGVFAPETKPRSSCRNRILECMALGKPVGPP